MYGAVAGPAERRWCLCGERVPDTLVGQGDLFHERQSSEIMQGDHSMKTRLFTPIPGMTLAGLLTLTGVGVLGFGPVAHADGGGSKAPGSMRSKS